MQALANGRWLTHERVRRIAALFALASFASIAFILLTSNGTIDRVGRPLGTDFSNVWTAGRMALDGNATQAWSWPHHFAMQRQLHGSDVPLFGWHYPPPFLLVAALLATVPYVPALILWQTATLASFASMMLRLVPGRDTLLLTLAAPVTLVCVTHGHNGFLTALLLGGGLMLMDRRPLAAGLLFGCLIYKPQFAFVIPPLLIAAGNWRAVAGAAASSSLLVALTLAAWGWPVWQAFIDSLPLTRTIVIEQGNTGWHKIMSPFAAVRLWGGGLSLAYTVQAAFTAACVGGAILFGRMRGEPELRNAYICAAVLLSTPYVLDYDFVVLLPALAWLWLDGRRHVFRPWDRTLMATVWVAPIAARQVAEFALVPLGLASALIVAGIALRRVVRASPSRR